MKRKLAIFFRAANGGHNGNPYCAGGLNANCLHTAGVLRRMGYEVDLVSLDAPDPNRIVAHLEAHRETTDALLEGIWLPAVTCVALARHYPKVRWAVRSHSKMGFLQVEPGSIATMRGIVGASKDEPNLHFASNNADFARSIREVYGPCLYLPNLYDLEAAPPRRWNHHAGPLRIASFGATRLLKLHPSAALAALQAARRLERKLEFYVNVDKTPGGGSVLASVRNLFAGLDWAQVVEIGWLDPPQFKETIASMDVVLALSATETFCLVAADAVAAKVPVVAGPAVDWLPWFAKANPDDAEDVAAKAVAAVRERGLAEAEHQVLRRFIDDAHREWASFLG